MENLRLGLLIGAVLAVLAGVWLCVAGFVALPFRMDWLGSSPQGVVLIYEVDPESMPDAGKINMDKLVVAINRRVNPGGQKEVTVRKCGMEEVEVIVPERDEAEVAWIEHIISQTGELQFRILADEHDPKGDAKGIIERAKADPSKTKVTDRHGRLLAWWVPVKAGEERSFVGPGYEGAGRRTRTQGGREITEFLVLNDIYNVTGAHLRAARPAVDRQGRPCVNFNFDAAGAKLFGTLTADHLPDKLTGFTYRLGIVLDGELLSAPSIQSTIYDCAEITGSFTKQEVEDFARVLNAGSLPARIRLVKKHGAP